MWSPQWHRRALLLCIIHHLYHCNENVLRTPMRTDSLRWAGSGWYFRQGKVGRHGSMGRGPSFNHLPTHDLFETCPTGWVVWEPRLVLANSMLLASFLALSSLPPPQEMTKKEKLDHLGLWEGLAERKYLTVTVLGRPDFISSYPGTDWNDRQGPFMEVSITLQECAFGNFNKKNLHFQGDMRFLLGRRVSLCSPASLLTCTPDAFLANTRENWHLPK